MKTLTIRSVCTATVHETWTLTVPDDFTPTPDGDTLEEALDAAGIDGWTCEDKISDETDRDIQDVVIGASVADHEMSPCGHPEDMCASPGCCTTCNRPLAWDGRGGYAHA